ncbi:putative golgin subfamily A member 8F/8G isoform X3 [Papio anubis]|uniref:putative golgin subfamily A member 8F/8G isoform X3 n=1 Tax=Papio anubis TaxID=9555 RepID=UPI0012AE1DFA|nr:putative golgin subfamily A member 8F/8G isoform X3 [Papio anubis]
MHECPDLGAKGEASAAGGEASGAGGEALGAGREASGAGREASAAGRAIQWLRGAGDGGGHLDSEEEEAPQPMLTVPEDLESWEAMESSSPYNTARG